MSNAPILIIGAGPTGLNLALRLARSGTAFCIIDEHDGPAQESRALAVHARTLEFYHQLGLADAIVDAGTRIGGIRMYRDGRARGHIKLGDISAGLSPYPFILDFPQDEHERLLVDRLRDMGIEVERRTALASFTQDPDGADAVLIKDGQRSHVRASYICGCDGARSKVREGIGASFSGGTYQHLYYVADVRLETPDTGNDFHIATGTDTFALRLPARKGQNERLIGFAPDGIEHPVFEDVRADAEHLLDIRVAEVNWFSTYRVHHRVAGRFRKGRAFLLGDAGHLHSPVGGQGMNTGIGDAVNLAWKLAAVVGGRAAEALLDTYEAERIPFARSLVATTDRVFQTVVSDGVDGHVLRSLVLPTLIPAAMHVGAARKAMFRLASQIAIHYPESSLSVGRAGDVAGGDRLPWVGSIDNHAPLISLDWQLHVYGDVAPAITASAQHLGLALHRFDWSAAVGKAGMERGSGYLVRPDGHIALAMSAPTAAALEDYAKMRGLVFVSE
jgi:2-polyprenyl-6-methoxyphenol hydroxylase-like FAD-dependent oxidoreductase